MGRGTGICEELEVSPRTTVSALMPNEFDPAAVDNLNWREVSLEVIVESGDPNPNQLKLVALNTSLGSWQASYDRSGLWKIDGTPLGPRLQAELARMQRQAYYGVVDYSDQQSS